MNEKDNVREKLLEASIKLFLAKGYAGAHVNEIASAAGVSKGALYWYFKSKDDILSGIVERYNDEFIVELVKKMNNYSGDFVAKFKAFYKFSSEFSREYRELLLVFSTLLIEFTGTGSDLERRMKQVHRQYGLVIQRLLEDGIQEGTVGKEIDPAIYAELITSTLYGSLLQWYVNDAIHERDPAIDARYGKANRDALLKVVLSEEPSSTGGSVMEGTRCRRSKKP